MNKSLDEENENILKNSNITNNIEEIIKTKQMSYYNSYLLEIKNEYNQFDKKNNIQINYNFSITTNEQDEQDVRKMQKRWRKGKRKDTRKVKEKIQEGRRKGWKKDGRRMEEG